MKKGGQINNLVFPLWDESGSEPAPREGLFTSVPSTSSPICTDIQFSDPDGQPKLSPEQTAVSAVWRRPDLPEDNGPPIHILPEDILQHVVTDCSVCASISVCLEHSRRFGTLVRCIHRPYAFLGCSLGTQVAETPLYHYCDSHDPDSTCIPVCVDHRERLDFKFLFNGAWRRVSTRDPPSRRSLCNLHSSRLVSPCNTPPTVPIPYRNI